MISIELLSPARDMECGIAAIDHGADAVYIGASRFGARAAAGNSAGDIAALCTYAHRFGAKVYVTINTILYDRELEDMRRLAWELHRAGADAFIVQDMAMMGLSDMPPVPLHASTQMDNRTPWKVAALRDLGFGQVVLARELSLEDIAAIHAAVPEVRLEAFCHGALCVSYSGRCYASLYCFGRSANRGECSQFCRLPFRVADAGGHTVECGAYPLSLKDMNRSASLEAMMDAGVRSFKIEGRLKDVSYVKNVTAYYRGELDRIMARRPEYAHSSYGNVEFAFTPDPARSFSRGFTECFLHGRSMDMSSSDTPKSKGVAVGHVKEVRRGCIVVAGTQRFENGDGLCYKDRDGILHGFRVNRADDNHLYPAEMPDVRKGDMLWRNYDHGWERLLSRKTAVRRIPASMVFDKTERGFSLAFAAQDGAACSREFDCPHRPADKDQTDTIRDTLCKLGDTVYSCTSAEVRCGGDLFVPRSLLAEWRRTVVEEAQAARPLPPPEVAAPAQTAGPLFVHDDYQSNISNRLAREFYERTGAVVKESALEVTHADRKGMTLMTCRFCLKYEMGWCAKRQGARCPHREPLYLESNDGRRFRLEFDCANCEMRVTNE